MSSVLSWLPSTYNSSLVGLFSFSIPNFLISFSCYSFFFYSTNWKIWGFSWILNVTSPNLVFAGFFYNNSFFFGWSSGRFSWEYDHASCARNCFSMFWDLHLLLFNSLFVEFCDWKVLKLLVFAIPRAEIASLPTFLSGPWLEVLVGCPLDSHLR